MQNILQRTYRTIKAIFSESNHPDSATQRMIYKNNIINLSSSLLFCTLYAVFSVFYTFSSLKLFIIGGIFWLLCSFVLLSRSHPCLFNVMCVSIAMFIGFKSLDLAQEAAYFYLGFIFVLLPFAMIISGDTNLTFVAGIVQIFMCLTKFKEKLGILVREEEPEVFADKFVNLIVLFFIIRLIVNFNFLRTLNHRTVELSKAKSALETALEQQKTFIFSFSHELRNPMNSLLGNLNLVLHEENLSAKVVEMINIAKICGELLLRNINNVLETGKHEVGRLEINPVSTHLPELFHKTWSIYCELLRQKKLKSSLKIEKNIPSLVKIDAHKLNQVLQNLVGNAIKFKARGSVTVTVKWLKSKEVSDKSFEPVPYDDIDEGIFEKEENVSIIDKNSFSQSLILDCPYYDEVEQEERLSQSESQGVLKMIVKDSGPGMKKECLEKLFNKFCEVSEDASHRQLGTGFGLYITKEICAAMGGEIRAYSRPGAGSTFIACIPTKVLPTNNSEKVDFTNAIHELSAKNLKAIVADGCPFNANLTRDYLRKLGASVPCAVYNGSEALTMYKRCRMANGQLYVVLLDIRLSVIATHTVCDKIREYERQEKLKPVMIVLMTGNYNVEEVHEYSNHQIDGYLRQPLSFPEFSKALYLIVSKPKED